MWYQCTANAAPQRFTIFRKRTNGPGSPLRDAVYVSLCDVHSRIIRRSLSTAQCRLLDWVAAAISLGKNGRLDGTAKSATPFNLAEHFFATRGPCSG